MFECKRLLGASETMNVSKANYICTGENVMPAVKNAIAQDKILKHNFKIISISQCQALQY